jgi:hypothetical protein
MGRRTIETGSDGRKKISPRESEDLQELSAGSDDSEELPDPTGGTYSRARKTVKIARAEMLQRAHFSVNNRITARKPQGNVRSLP